MIKVLHLGIQLVIQLWELWLKQIADLHVSVEF